MPGKPGNLKTGFIWIDDGDAVRVRRKPRVISAIGQALARVLAAASGAVIKKHGPRK